MLISLKSQFCFNLPPPSLHMRRERVQAFFFFNIQYRCPCRRRREGGGRDTVPFSLAFLAAPSLSALTGLEPGKGTLEGNKYKEYIAFRGKISLFFFFKKKSNIHKHLLSTCPTLCHIDVILLCLLTTKTLHNQ